MRKLYTEKELVEFGQYLLSEERTNLIKDNQKESDNWTLNDRLKEVYDADIKNVFGVDENEIKINEILKLLNTK